MNQWQKHNLGDLIEIKHGFAFKGKYFCDQPPGDILLTPGNFAVGGGFKGDKFKFYDGEVPSGYVLDKGDLIVTMTDLSKAGDTLGYPAIVPESENGFRFLHNQRLGKVLIKDSNKVLKDYIYYLLRTKEYRDEVLSGATGTTVKHTSPNRIKAFNFYLPSIDQQEAIAKIFSDLDAKIDLNRRMNETLEAMARAIFKKWFVDFEFPGYKKTRFVECLPEGWRLDDIGNVVTAVGGGTPSTKEKKFWNGKLHFVTPKDLSDLSSPVLLNTERCITEEGVKQISSGLLPAGTVLLSSRAPVGYLAISEVPVAVNQGFIAMACDKELPNYYILFWTMENLDTIKSNASGTTFPEISKKNFRPIKAIVPSREILEDFVMAVEPIYTKIVNNLRESNKLESIRDTLLPKLMSGEIRVKE